MKRVWANVSCWWKTWQCFVGTCIYLHFIIKYKYKWKIYALCKQKFFNSFYSIFLLILFIYLFYVCFYKIFGGLSLPIRFCTKIYIKAEGNLTYKNFVSMKNIFFIYVDIYKFWWDLICIMSVIMTGRYTSFAWEYYEKKLRWEILLWTY